MTKKDYYAEEQQLSDNVIVDLRVLVTMRIYVIKSGKARWIKYSTIKN
jgi:hypothetical protein